LVIIFFLSVGGGHKTARRMLNKKSLNKNYRKQELFKITQENQKFLQRLQEKESQYDVMSWEKERNKNEKWIRDMTEYQSVHFGGHSTIGKIDKMNTMQNF
jgi:hypothetical protein